MTTESESSGNPGQLSVQPDAEIAALRERVKELESSILDMARTGSEAWADLCLVMRSWQDKRGAERKPSGSVRCMRDAVISLQEMIERLESDREPVLMGLRTRAEQAEQAATDAEAECLHCQWEGRRDQLKDADKELAALRDKGGR